MDFKIELVPIPVSDVDRALEFYSEKAGFHLDHDVTFGEMRIVQLTPTGSACSIAFGKGIVGTEPGSVQGLHLVVADIHAARDHLVERGVDVSDVIEAKAEGKPTVWYAHFGDPDGNTWTLQAIESV